MYEIRGLVNSTNPFPDTLGILILRLSDGKYFKLKFKIKPNSRIKHVIHFIANELKCEPDEITNSNHVDFAIVRIPE